jgi:hypothetical protein
MLTLIINILVILFLAITHYICVFVLDNWNYLLIGRISGVMLFIVLMLLLLHIDLVRSYYGKLSLNTISTFHVNKLNVNVEQKALCEICIQAFHSLDNERIISSSFKNNCFKVSLVYSVNSGPYKRIFRDIKTVGVYIIVYCLITDHRKYKTQIKLTTRSKIFYLVDYGASSRVMDKLLKYFKDHLDENDDKS